MLEVPSALVVYLSEVSFLAACGVRALVRTHQRCAPASALRIVVTGVPRRVLELGGLAGSLPF
ncbi:STAS domain-containing protein [Amycolatopsis thermoflava]|uniref:hypothetical protein n=1 Tax=Amycolatopsis thermoflava TaxID=84480 RepID=UPI0039773617